MNSPFNSFGMPLLASDTISTHNRTAKLVVAPATREIHAGHHFTDCIDCFGNIAQANKVSSLDHSNDPYRFGLNLRP